MSKPAEIGPAIIETLYCEALVLADEARSAFDFSGRHVFGADNEDLARVALSCEALRTTTRMMHAIAWLLNQRAYFSGELTGLQLRRHGRLPPAQPDSSPDHLVLLGEDLVELVERTRQFYARVERLDRSWANHYMPAPAAVHRLHQRLGSAVAAL